MATVINGISYNNGDKFICAKPATGNANSAGTGNSAIALTEGKEYIFVQVGDYSVYPYLVHDGSNYIGWYTAEVFPTSMGSEYTPYIWDGSNWVEYVPYVWDGYNWVEHAVYIK